MERDAARAWMKTHTLKRKFTVKSFGGLDSPMTYGVLRPVILVHGAASWRNGPEAKFALEHEYIHMRRFDAAFKFALALALTLHWFKPAVWALYALANRDTVIWDNSADYFMFRDGYLTWYDEKEPQAADCRFVKVK